MEVVSTLLKPSEAGEGEGYGGGGFEEGMFGGGGIGGMGGFGGQTSNLGLCHTAIEALGNIGPTAKEALPLLKPLIDPSGPHGDRYQAHAKLAIARIEGREPPMSDEDYERREASLGTQGGFF